MPSFDLPVPGYSLAEDFAKRGFRVFVMDVRGWGSSTKPRAMDEPPETSAPLVPAKEAADDIATVVDSLKLDRFVLVGHSMGGSAAIAYTVTIWWPESGGPSTTAASPSARAVRSRRSRSAAAGRGLVTLAPARNSSPRR